MVAWASLDEALDYAQEQGWTRFYLCVRADGRYIAFSHKSVLTEHFDTLFVETTDREEIYYLLASARGSESA